MTEITDTFRNRLVKAMNMRNIKASDLAKQTGLSKAQISQYTNGIYEAKQSALHKLAVALNVSESWLMGYDVSIERSTDKVDILLDDVRFRIKEQYLSDEVKLIESIQTQYGKDAVTLLNMFMNLNDKGKTKALDTLEDLSAIEKYIK